MRERTGLVVLALVGLVVVGGDVRGQQPSDVCGQQPSDVRGQQPITAGSHPVRTWYPRINRASGYELDAGWALATQKRGWGGVSGLGLDGEGRVWVFHRGKTPVQIFKPDGTFERGWGEGLFLEPHQVRFDPSGDVWLADSGLHVVRKFSPAGELKMTLGTQGAPGQDRTHFNRPTDLAIGPRGDLYIADGYGNNRVVRFDASGKYKGEWGGLGSKRGQLSLPHAIAIDSRARLYVADRNNARVQIFDEDGKFLDEWVDLVIPWHIVITADDKVYVCGSSPVRWSKIKLLGLPLGVPPKDQVLMVFNTSGRMERLWTFPVGKGNGQLEWVHGMAVDRDGNVYLGDIQGKRVSRFRSQPPDREALGDAQSSGAGVKERD